MSLGSSGDEVDHLFPAEGPLGAPCPGCRLPGQVRMEHRREWADAPPGGWPAGVDAVRLAVACRRCGSDFLSATTELVAAAGVVAREMPWVTCQHCQHAEAARAWPWLRCDRCGVELRARYEKLPPRPLQ